MEKSFSEKCYTVLRKVPKGKVTTYKEIARALKTKAYRAVGTAMNKNPYAPEVPCHRVVNSNGNLGGFASGCENKIKLLKKEGVRIENNRVVDFEKVLYKF
ncbi:MAG: MGMT family protein [Nanoarchaeota archaeon]